MTAGGGVALTAAAPQPIPHGGLAIVVGAGGGIGQAMFAQLGADTRFGHTLALSRTSTPPLNLLDEASIARAAANVASLALPLRLVMVATGFLHGGGFQPEKALRQLDPEHLRTAFALNVIGPALLMKHLLPLLAPQGKSVFAALSAKVGSIGDNHLGGWYSYRASKAALNQLVRTAAIELQRRNPDAICVALHPGTVATPLSAPFSKTGLAVQTPAESAARLLAVVDGLAPASSGGFFDQHGEVLPW